MESLPVRFSLCDGFDAAEFGSLFMLWLLRMLLRKRSLAADNDNTVQHEVDPVDALPVKTLTTRLVTYSLSASIFVNLSNQESCR
nr:hypothetical protein [Tanacetum cinerariifolium]